jgi:hypothetical protein
MSAAIDTGSPAKLMADAWIKKQAEAKQEADLLLWLTYLEKE